jgi:hypothetical protein
MAYLLKERKRVPIPNSRLTLLGSPVKDRNSLVIPTVTGGCAADPTADKYYLYPGDPLAQVVRSAVTQKISVQANQIFKPWASVTWTAVDGATIAANAAQPSANNAYASMKVTQGAAGAGYAQLTQAGLTAAAAHTFSIMVKAFAAGDMGKTLRLYLDGTTADYTLTANWMPVYVTDASASGVSVDLRAYITGGAEGDSFLVSMAQLAQTLWPKWFSLGNSTAMTMLVPSASLPIYAGGPLSLIFLAQFPFDGDEVDEYYYLYDSNATAGNNRIWVYFSAVSKRMYIATTDAVAGVKQTYISTAGVLKTNQPHAIIATLDTVNNQRLYIDGVGNTAASSGTGVRESALPANIALGHAASPTYQVDSPFHASALNRVLEPSEALTISQGLGVA